MLAHKAEDEGVAVAENIAGLTGIVNHDVIPAVVYTYPEIASVGLTEEQGKERGAIKFGKFPRLQNSGAKTNRDTEGFVKFFALPQSDKVLGEHIIPSVAGTRSHRAPQRMDSGVSPEVTPYPVK